MIFVLGMPRSGTSLVSQMLAAHPAITNLGERIALGPALLISLARPKIRDTLAPTGAPFPALSHIAILPDSKAGKARPRALIDSGRAAARRQAR